MTSRPIAVVSCLLAIAACGANEPRTDAERLDRGIKSVQRMSANLESATEFSVKTQEVRERLKADGTPERVNVVREVVIRRPDRMYFKATGDVDTEGWYDGVGLTVALHNEKVFAQSRMPETLDRMLDALHERYDVPLPLSDFLYSSPAKALLSTAATGGWVNRETIDGKQSDHLAFKDRGAEWELWVAATGSPLPIKAVISIPNSKRLRRLDLSFVDWDFTPSIPADRFDARVGQDYEGIAMIQRAAILRHLPEDDPAKTAATKK